MPNHGNVSINISATSDVDVFRAALRAALDAAEGDNARAVWQTLGASGVTAALYPGEAGRVELQPDLRRLAELLTTLDARYPLGVVLSICVQVATVVPLLSGAVAAGADGPVTAGLHGLLRGETVVALAATDVAASGSDLLGVGTTAKLAGAAVRVDGGKDWITNALTCDAALVLARHREARHFTSFCWILVPVPAPGVTVRPATRAFAGSGVGHLRLDGVRLDGTRLVGRPGRALPAFARQIGVERLAGALWSKALCRRLLADLDRWLRGRPSGDRTLWDNPAIRERFARCLLAVRQVDALCAQVLRDQVGPVPTVTGMVLKSAAAEMVERVLAECVHLRGADAFRDGGEAGLRAEAAMFGIAGGATGAMLAGLADHSTELLTEIP